MFHIYFMKNLPWKTNFCEKYSFNPQMPFLMQLIMRCSFGNWTFQFQILLSGGRGRALLIIVAFTLWRNAVLYPPHAILVLE